MKWKIRNAEGLVANTVILKVIDGRDGRVEGLEILKVW